jgi:hypothetical protein
MHPMMMRGPPPPPWMMMPGGHPMDPMPPPGPGSPYVTQPPDNASQYGTIRRGPIIEEPIYGAPPFSPPYPPEHYDEYYNAYNRGRSPATSPTMHKRRAGSQASARPTPADAYWDQFESGIYRRPMINERAFMTSVTRAESRGEKAPPAPDIGMYDMLV